MNNGWGECGGRVVVDPGTFVGHDLCIGHDFCIVLDDDEDFVMIME